MEILSAFFNSSGEFLGIVILLFGGTGMIVGILQAMVGRELNLWPIQVTFGVTTALLGILAIGATINELLDAVATVTNNRARDQMFLQGYANALLIGKVTLVLLMMQVLFGSFGRVSYVNGTVEPLKPNQP